MRTSSPPRGTSSRKSRKHPATPGVDRKHATGRSESCVERPHCVPQDLETEPVLRLRTGPRMSNEAVEVLIVGGGQAGLAMSEHLSACDVSHLVLERQRIAERWRSERWDSLVANGPAWHDRFPGLEFSGVGPDDFPGKERVAEYFAEYADRIAAPIRCGVDVLSVRRQSGRPGFRAETSD